MGVSRPTEMTIRDLLQEELRKKGVVVVPEFSVSTPVGLLKPDILLKNGAQYVVETKLGSETKLLEAVVKLYDYSKYVTEAYGAFAVLFPEELRRPWPPEVWMRIAVDPKLQYSVVAIFKDLRPSQSFKGNLSEITEWMASHVLKAPIVEADTGFAIRVLRDAVSYLTASVRQLQDKELEDIFGGKTVFENILQYEEGKYPLEEMRHAAAYLLINQLLFYHVLSKVDAGFPALNEEKIKKPADLAQYFEPVLKRNYSSIFGFDVASRLPANATDVVKKTVMAVKAIAPEKIRHDLLGKVFHELIPFEVRKSVAAFYTNNEAAEILAQLAIEKPDAKVMDLACGSGTLLVAAYRRKRELLQKEKGTVELEDHKRFLEQDLTGIDIMPFAAHLAVVHLSLQALLYETEKVRIAVWDSTELKPGQTIPAVWSELKAAYRRPTLDMFTKGSFKEEAYITKGAMTLEGVGGEEIPLEQADLIIMNPPFTRQQRIPLRYKEMLAKRFFSQSEYVHGQMGYHGYFILLADRFLKNQGRLALVLPASVLNADGFFKIRRLLTSFFHIEHIITTLQRAAFSEGAQFREILLVAKKTEQVTSNKLVCTITELKRLPSTLEEAEEFALKIKKLAQEKGKGLVYNDEKMQVTLVPMKELRDSVDNLFKFIAFSDKKLIDMWQSIVKVSKDKLVEFGEFINRYGSGPKEGAALGQILKGGGIGAFYIHKDASQAIKKTDVWILKDMYNDRIRVEHKGLHRTFDIPRSAVYSAMRRFSGSPHFDISKELDFVISDAFSNVREFLRLSLGREVDINSLVSWNRYLKGLLGNLLLANHVDVSAPGTSILTYYSSDLALVPRSMWSVKVTDKSAKILTLWLNSTFGLLQILWLRRETRGAYIWLVASTIKKLKIPDIDKLHKEKVEQLLNIFDKYKEIEFPSILDQLKNKFGPRVEIDRGVLKALGFNDNEIERFLDYIYPALANEIEQLKKLMEG